MGPHGTPLGASPAVPDGLSSGCYWLGWSCFGEVVFIVGFLCVVGWFGFFSLPLRDGRQLNVN